MLPGSTAPEFKLPLTRSADGALRSKKTRIYFFMAAILAASASGVSLIEQLKQLTGADIAASTDETGSAPVLGGNWNLQITSGAIETSVAVDSQLQNEWQHLLANTAPTLSGANNLSTINEDDTTNSGTLVSALIVGTVSDPDAGAVSGIAVTAVVNTNGAWQYSTNGGSAWTAFGSPSAANARLLAADANTYVRFVPNADFDGTVNNGITFRAWDQTSGVAEARLALRQTAELLRSAQRRRVLTSPSIQ